MASFAAVAVVLAALGMYGVLAYLVAGRRREIGILTSEPRRYLAGDLTTEMLMRRASGNPSLKADSMEDGLASRAGRDAAFEKVFQSVWYRLVLLFAAVYQTVFWFVLGPSNPAYAVGMVGTTFALGPALGPGVKRRVPRQWFRVLPGERVLHRILGVEIFAWFLDFSRWNRVVAEPMRGFAGLRAGLPSLEQSILGNMTAHGACFAIHVLLAFLALFGRHPGSGALWMLLPGVVVHLYPVLLQRSLMLRLQPLLNKTGIYRPVSN